MVRTWGMNIPPELAHDVERVLERRVGKSSQTAGIRRRTSGISRGGRKKVNDSFLKSVACWHMQSIDEKKRWYNQATGESMRYYNYFMSQTIGPFFYGTVPSWCSELDDGMMQYTGSEYDTESYYDPDLIYPGVTVKLSVTLAWARMRENNDFAYRFYFINDYAEFHQAEISIEGDSYCEDMQIREHSDPDWNDSFKRATITGESSPPVTFDLYYTLPSFLNTSYPTNYHVDFSPYLHNFSGNPDNSPLVWVYGYSLEINGELIIDENYEGDDLRTLEDTNTSNGVFKAVHDPWKVFGLSDPVCLFGEVE